MQLAVLPLSSVVTVITAVPADIPLISHSPFSFAVTVATPVSLLSHLTVLYVALEGVTVAVRVVVPPTVRLAELLSRVTPVTATVAALTVTVQVASFPPSAVVTVISAVPALTALTLPSASTVATEGSLDFQLTALYVASEGVIVALSCLVPPSSRTTTPSFRLTPVTDIVAALTVTLQVASFPPSAVVTVISAVPALTALTLPSASTVATEGSLDFQLTALYVASEGVIVALSCLVPPSSRTTTPSFRLTPVTDIVAALTVTLQLASLPPSAFTVIVASPGDTAVTFPLWSTVATAVLLLSHVTLLFVAVEGSIVAVRVSVLPFSRLNSALLSLTPVTLIPFTVPLPLVFSTVPLTFTVISTLV